MKLHIAERGYFQLPRQRVVQRAVAWMARFRRLTRDYERLSASSAALHFVAFSTPLFRKAADLAKVRNSLGTDR